MTERRKCSKSRCQTQHVIQNADRHFDSNGQYSITALSDGGGSIVERYAYTAYGQVTIADASGNVQSASASNNRYTYTGREWDEGLALYHFRARMYDAVAGKFVSRDPIGFDGSPYNLYEYGISHPLQGIDPEGKGYIGEGWDALCNSPCHPVEILTAGTHAIIAQRITQSRNPDGVQGGRGDAFRHCLWNCMMATGLNPECQRWITEAHERENLAQGGPQADVDMDTHNNGVGLQIGSRQWTEIGFTSAYEEALAGGELIVIVNHE